MWINSQTLDVYRTREDVRAAFPNTSFTRTMAPGEIESLQWTYGDPESPQTLAEVELLVRMAGKDQGEPDRGCGAWNRACRRTRSATSAGQRKTSG